MLNLNVTDVTTRGKYYPDKNLATEKDPPLYLHVTATTKEILDAAVAKLQDMIDQGVMPTPPAPIARPPVQVSNLFAISTLHCHYVMFVD